MRPNFAILSGTLFFNLLMPAVICAQNISELELMMSSHHFAVTIEQLETTAGGRNALVSQLLNLRRDNLNPIAATRAEKLLLLQFSEEIGVQEALIDDMLGQETPGLGRVLVLYLDKIQDSSFKKKLTDAARYRAQTDKTFRIYSETISKTTDPQVKRIVQD